MAETPTSEIVRVSHRPDEMRENKRDDKLLSVYPTQKEAKQAAKTCCGIKRAEN
jgi:hypothetical protein